MKYFLIAGFIVLMLAVMVTLGFQIFNTSVVTSENPNGTPFSQFPTSGDIDDRGILHGSSVDGTFVFTGADGTEIMTNDFTQLPGAELFIDDSSNFFYIIEVTDEYSITWEVGSSDVPSMLLGTVLSEPFERNLDLLETRFLDLLGVAEDVACRLPIFIYDGIEREELHEGTLLSFCSI